MQPKIYYGSGIIVEKISGENYLDCGDMQSGLDKY